jgi:hypothetical protein
VRPVEVTEQLDLAIIRTRRAAVRRVKSSLIAGHNDIVQAGDRRLR